MPVEHQVSIGIRYGKICFEEGFRADLVAEKRVIIELKYVEKLDNSYKKSC